MGDFNTPLQGAEKFGGTQAQLDSKTDLMDFINVNALVDTDLTGASYTWSNRRDGKDLIQVYEALWVDRITPKRAIGMAPYELVYGIGTKVSLPLELAVVRLQTVIEDSFFQNALEKRFMYFMKLEEEREMLVDRITNHHNRVKKIFDMRARPRGFLKGDEVLLWDKRREPKGAHGKFDSLWKGSFKIHEVARPNAFRLNYSDGMVMPYTYNGQDLKLYKL
ncbi:uncharacterized protein LOC131876583 [Cryptomeria japonica]|uniref:uncharacterized protein LOC131876583 n=1 Tax=Cryptomeria japonica TaxID=3369 RepID=UPI0027D9D180|nr:uncharacterized protein LOC131876583 [Cryptomeria japonica]